VPFNTALLGLLGCLLVLPATATAQDYRIYTSISIHDSSMGEDQPAEVIGRSLTIWHAGKVYDYMDGVGEVVVHDPLQERFTILNGTYHLGCTVDSSELRHYLKVARSKVKEIMTEAAESGDAESERTIAKMAFLLDPEFTFQLDEGNRRLLCDSPQMSYDVQCMEAPNADVAENYRAYADRAAQLNFVLHEQSLMPQARMLVNAAIAEKGWIPTRVQLSLKDTKDTKLTAEHKIQWELGSTDRTRLLEWRRLQNDSETKFVSFQEYQRSFMAAVKAKSRE